MSSRGSAPSIFDALFLRPEATGPAPAVVYHATSPEHRESIAEHGLLMDPSGLGGSHRRRHRLQDPAVFTATDVLNAIVWCDRPEKADVWAIETEGLPVVCDRHTDHAWAIECDLAPHQIRLLGPEERAALLAEAREERYNR